MFEQMCLHCQNAKYVLRVCVCSGLIQSLMVAMLSVVIEHLHLGGVEDEEASITQAQAELTTLFTAFLYL